MMTRAVLVACFALACAKSGTEDFRVRYPDASNGALRAKVATRMQAKPAADCQYDNGREARWANTGARVVAGELPPGLALEDGAIGGTPTAAGTWRVTIAFSGVTCGSTAQPDQRIDLSIVVRS